MKRLFTIICAFSMMLTSLGPVFGTGAGSGYQASSGINPVQYVSPANGSNVDPLKIAANSGRAVVGWSLEGVGPEVEGFKVYAGQTNPPQTLVFNGFNAQCAINNVEYNKTYYWKVVPYGINGEAQDVPVWSFTTTDRVPFFHEGFTGSASIPDGWVSQDGTGSGISWYFDGSEAGIGTGSYKDDKGQVFTTLTSPAINCSGLEDIYLYLNHNVLTSIVDIDQFLGIEVSNDGENWTDVVRFHEPLHPLYTHFYYYMDYDVSAVADNQPQVWFRLVFQGDTDHAMRWRIREIGLKFFAEELLPAAEFSPEDGATEQPIHFDLGWTRQVGATPLGYRVYMDQNNPPQTLIVNKNVTWNSVDTVIHLLRDLEYNTTYYWKVVPYNAGGALNDVPVWSFTTAEEFVISDVPFFEDFDGVKAPYFPLSWTRHQKFLDHFTDLRTVTQHTNNANIPPYSGLNHVRFGKVSDPTAELVLVTPEIDMDIQELRVRFMGMATTIGPNPSTPSVAIEVGTMTDPNNPNTFSHVRTVQVGPQGGLPYVMDYKEFGTSFEYQPVNGQYIAFRAATTQASATRIYIDDFTLEAAPVDPILKPEPESFDFGIVELGLPETTEFTIYNYGGGILTIQPEDIFIEGPGADAFHLTNISSPASLQAFESITLGVLFDTDDLELKEAILVVNDIQIPLAGEFVRPDITSLPYFEFFDDVESPKIPFGWRKDIQSVALDADIYVSHRPLGLVDPVSLPNVLNMRNRGDADAEMFFISPPVELQEPVENLRVRFHAFSAREHNYLEVGIMTDRDDPETFVPAGKVWLWPEGAMWWEYAIDVKVPDTSSFFIAMRPDFFRRARGISIDNLIIETAPEEFPVDFLVKENSPEGESMKGVALRVIGHSPLTEKRVISDSQGTASLTLAAGYHTVFVKQPGYHEQAVEFEVNNSIDNSVEVRLSHIIHPPFNPVVSTYGLEPGSAMFQWNGGEGHDFRYDSGNMMIHIGFGNAEVYPLELMPLGTAFKYHGDISQVSWFTSDADNVGQHETVALWVLGLDEYGFPDRNQLLYHNPHAPNTDNVWTTYRFPEPLRTPNGFFVGLAYDGFLGIGIDNGVTHPYQFRDLTHFTVVDMHDPNFVDVLPLEAWGLPFNPMIRAYGYKISDLEFKPFPYTEDMKARAAELPELKRGDGFMRLDAGEPDFDKGNKGAVAAAYHVYLNEMTQPFAYWLNDTEHQFTNLEPGTYTAGVQTAFSTGVSEILDVSFTVESSTSVNMPEGIDTKVFPNPASNLLQVVSGEMIQQVRMYDLLGQLVYSQRVDDTNARISVGHLREGVYLLQVQTAVGQATHRIQITK
jgi:hypothetical protein